MDYTRDFDQYFNHLLRDTLDYPEKFIIKSSNSSVTLIPDSPSKLLEIIKTNPDIKRKILSQILAGLQDKDNTITNVYFATHGTDIVVEIESMNKFLTLDVGVYANIASDFDSEVELENFCMSTKRTREVCGLSPFWSELLKQKFPQYYVEGIKGYNWEKIYKGLLWLHNEFKFRDTFLKKHGITDIEEVVNMLTGRQNLEDRFRMVEIWGNLRRLHKEALYYLVKNKLSLFKKDIPYIIEALINIEDDDLLVYILDNYTINPNTLEISIGNYILNIPMVKLLIDKLSQQNINIDIRTTVANILQSILYHDEIELTLDQFKFYFNYLYPNGTSEDMFDFLLWGSAFNDKTVDYVVSQLPENLNPHTAFEYITDKIYNTNLVEALWNKYKSVLQDRKEDIINSVRPKYLEERKELRKILSS